MILVLDSPLSDEFDQIMPPQPKLACAIMWVMCLT